MDTRTNTLAWSNFSKNGGPFEKPPFRDGAPDYTDESNAKRYDEFLAIRDRLNSLDPGGWTIEEQVDWHVLRRGAKRIRFQLPCAETLGAGSGLLPDSLDVPK